MRESGHGLVSVVDDDPSLRRSVKNLLTSVGLSVEVFASAESFLRHPSRELTTCLILDLRLKGVCGLELLETLRAAGSKIPVVILTAHNDEDTRHRALQRGAVAFLSKPFRADELIATVKKAIARNGIEA